MKRLPIPDVSAPHVTMPRVSVPDVRLPSAPDVSGLSDSLVDLAETAADAVSSAAGRIPGIDDYRASNRRRNVLVSVGAIAAVVLVIAIVRRRNASDDVPMGQPND